MSKLDEIAAKRAELAAKREDRAAAEVAVTEAIRDAELDREIVRLDRELAEEETTSKLIEKASENPAATASFGKQRTPEEILAASAYAVAIAEGRDPAAEEPTEPAKTEPAKTEPAKTSASTVATSSTAAKSAEEK